MTSQKKDNENENYNNNIFLSENNQIENNKLILEKIFNSVNLNIDYKKFFNEFKLLIFKNNLEEFKSKKLQLLNYEKSIFQNIISNNPHIKSILNFNINNFHEESLIFKKLVDCTGSTLLHLASGQESDIFVEYLLGFIDKNSSDCFGRTPLHISASKNNMDCLKLLISAGADINCRSKSGETPLVKAVRFDKIKNVKILLRFGADPTISFEVS